MVRFALVISTVLIFSNLYSQYFDLNDRLFNKDDVFICNGVYFDYNDTSLRPESKSILDSIEVFLKKNIELVVEIGVHFDTRVSDVYCVRLDKARAKTLVEYFVEKGISIVRLKSKGYWDSNPIILDDEIEKMSTKEEKEKAHLVNRRIELKILMTKIEN